MKLSSFRQLLAGIAFLLAAACTAASPPPPSESPNVSMAIVNATIWTGDPTHASAQALAIAGDRIVAVGTNDEIRKMAGSAELVDARGQFVVPGFIDSHVHFLDGGARLASVQLRDASTREEFAARIAAFAKTVPAGTWITGGDWDHQLWGGELPRRDWIDAVTAESSGVGESSRRPHGDRELRRSQSRWPGAKREASARRRNRSRRQRRADRAAQGQRHGAGGRQDAAAEPGYEGSVARRGDEVRR